MLSRLHLKNKKHKFNGVKEVCAFNMRIDEKKILLTDTNNSVLKKHKSELVENGYEISVSDSLDSLQLLLKISCFDLILLDVTIPDLNVINIIESIRNANTHTAVIISNDAANYDLAIETVKRGAFDMLVKPYDSIALMSMIDDALNQSAQAMQINCISDKTCSNENIYQFMIENSQDIQYLLDKDGNFIYINSRVNILLGYDNSELIGKHYTELVHKDDLDKAMFRLHDKRANNLLSQSIELRLNCKNNSNGFLYFDIKSMAIPNGIDTSPQRLLSDHENSGSKAVTFGIAHDATIRKKVERIAQNKASYDHLTSLPNNILFHDRLNLAIAQAKRDDSVFSVMYLDLDGFKKVNDIYGHHIGDKVLQIMSSRMLNCLRESDTLARVGGDEFTLLLPHVGNNMEANIIAKKLTECINKYFFIGGDKHTLTVSIGIAFFPEDGDTRESIIQASDKAMYQVKNGTKNGYQFHGKILN